MVSGSYHRWNMQEEWREIKDWPGYWVSNLGRVASRFENRGNFLPQTDVDRLLKQFKWDRSKFPKYDGQIGGCTKYYTVCLVRNDEAGKVKKTKSVHRLVAQAFIPNLENKQTVNHKDGNGLNNHVDNLEWATRSEQVQHMLDTGTFKVKRPGTALRGADVGTAKMTEDDVKFIRSSNLSNIKLGKMFNMHHSSISDIKNRKSWKHII